MLSAILNGGYSTEEIIMQLVACIVSSAIIVFLVLPLHEFAHALVADKLGDPTPRYQRRLTVNPLAHIDWLGAIMILIVGFGWARPVQVNMNNFRKPKLGMAAVAVAGPISNLLAALVSAFLWGITRRIFYISALAGAGEIVYYIFTFLNYLFFFLMEINISLAVFNLIPIPPLDGSRVLSAFLPNRLYYRFMQLERFSFIIIIILSVSGTFSGYMNTATNGIFNLFYKITTAIQGF